MNKGYKKTRSWVLTILFTAIIVIKLTGQIDLSWWWVLSPVWVPLAFTSFVMMIAGWIIIFHLLLKDKYYEGN